MDTQKSKTVVPAGVLGEDELITELAAQIAAAETDGKSVSISVIDLDEFGKINEEHGREAGDAVLQRTCDFLRGIAEQGDAVMHRAMFRHGGDEFVVLLPGVEKEDAFLLTEKARAEFASKRGQDGVDVTFSAAIATYPEDDTRAQDVLRKAIDAIYRAKTTGRNKVCLAREERMVTKTSHYTQPQLARLSLLSKRENIGEAVILREALDNLLRRYGV